ncbi:hypothetical protein [Sporosarcina sp. FSL W7-1283]|uniref:hypothetical protein n=1 Tax=Sporosarcina sp. FSL W7-1283 TaxID=2921560 RepID=UPI0030F8B5D8
MEINLKKEYMIDELNLPENAILDEITDTSRWSVHHRIIFAYQGKFWETYYSEGATENQCEAPWEHEDLVECSEVELKEIKVKKWIKK